MSTGFGGSSVTGTFRLTRLALRRDRLMIPVWTALIAGFVIVTASSFASLYPTAASRIPFARGVEANSGLITLVGKPFDLTTTGGLTAWRIGSIAAIFAAIMSYLLAVRHTRAEEEADRLELLRAQAIGVLAPLTAGVLTVAAGNAVVAVVIIAGLLALGLPLAGSVALAAAIAGAGLVFGSIGAAAAQLTRTGRAANGISSALLALAFVLRATGDGSHTGWLSWLSPIGWAQQVRAFAGDRWWVLLLDLALVAVLLTAALGLAAGRDLGDGVLPVRPGPAHASAALRTTGALAWRLHRPSLLGWAAGFAASGIVFGGLSGSVADLVNGSPQLADMLESLGGRQGVVDAYLSTMLGFSAITAGAYAVQGVLRLASEESGQRAEPLLALPVTRTGWALGHLLLSLAGTAVLMLVLGVTLGVAHGADSDLRHQVLRLTGAALSSVPAAWVLGAVTMAIYGAVPRFPAAAWGAVLLCVFLLLVGPLAGFPQWILDLSPFTHSPKLPGGTMNWTPVAWLTLVTLGLCGAGLAALRRRDIG